MKASNLLKQAAACKSNDDAKKLLGALTEAFQAKKSAIGGLETANGDYSLEDGGVFVSVEFNRVISDDYIITIKPEIRDGKMGVYVVTNRMLDGLGMASQKWVVATARDELEEVIEVDEDSDILDVANLASDLAFLYLQRLLVQVGVPFAIAGETAKQCWNGGKP